MFKKLISLFLIFNPAIVFAITIDGSLKNQQVESFTVSTDSISKTFDKQNFSLQIPDNDIYQLKIEADGYYPLIQTFSHHELTQLSENQIQIPAIELVKQKEGRVMLAFGGDVMMGRRYAEPHQNEAVLIRSGYEKEDTRKIVAHMKPYLELADYSAINLETQISDVTPKQRAPKSVTFYSPPEALGALKWAGIDYVTLGNNHIYDYLDEGLISTLKYLKEYDMDFSGAGLNQLDALEPHKEELNGQPYSMLGFVGWEGGFSPNQVAAAQKGGSALGSKENIVETVSKESAQNRTTVVQYHGSLEYKSEPTAMTESRLKTAIDKGADLVIAHHPHVTQGFELYKGKLIAYSMGNFIFDQYFHDTPHSFVLYVWMDGQEFYKAEIVPIYIKGYMPIPATGIQRNTIIKRVNYLSELRGLKSGYSGGHITFTPENKDSNKSQLVKFEPGNSLMPLYSFPVNGVIANVTVSEDAVQKNRYRLGKNLVNGGDFETYKAFTSDERGWVLSNASISNEEEGKGSHVIKLFAKKDKTPAKVGMKTFRRVFKAGNPVTYQAELKTNQKVNAKLYFQRRKTRDKLKQAYSNEPVLLAEQSLLASEDWQNINFEFNTPRVGYRSYRVWLQIELDEQTSKPTEVYMDEVSLIEWQAHYNEFSELPRNNEILGLSTHIGLETAAKKAIELEIIYQ